MKLVPYPEYKETYDRWFCRLPSHWKILPLCAIAKVKSDVNCQDRELLSVYLDLGVIRFSDAKEKRANATSEDLSKYQVVDSGDFVLNNQQAWRGSVGISKFSGIVSPAYLVLSIHDELDTDYANYLFRDRKMIDQYLICSKGVGSIQRNLYWPHLKRVTIAVPHYSEQKLIARFIRWKTFQINKFIQNKRQLIELLNEQKQNIINEAMTRGLNPDVKLKSSGVKWIGDIPKHWESQRLKTRLIQNDSGVWGDNFSDTGTIVLRSTEQTMSGGWHIKIPAKIELSPREIESARLETGDLVVTKSSGSQAHIGKTSLVNPEIGTLGCCFSNFMQRLRVNSRTDPEYVWYNLNSITGREQLVFHSTTTTGLGNLNGTILGNCQFAFPPLSEQVIIVEYLKQATTNIDQAITRAEREIELIQEYRTRLISDAVTGQIDVRGIEVPEITEEDMPALNEDATKTEHDAIAELHE
ncbi:MAG: restriction endonuclease subunit S [Pseudohongiellaceae bacterium]